MWPFYLRCQWIARWLCSGQFDDFFSRNLITFFSSKGLRSFKTLIQIFVSVNFFYEEARLWWNWNKFSVFIAQIPGAITGTVNKMWYFCSLQRLARYYIPCMEIFSRNFRRKKVRIITFYPFHYKIRNIKIIFWLLRILQKSFENIQYGSIWLHQRNFSNSCIVDKYL